MTLTINEKAVVAYARTIAQAMRKLREAGLDDEARALEAFARGRIDDARATAAASDPLRAAIADLARRTAA